MGKQLIFWGFLVILLPPLVMVAGLQSGWTYAAFLGFVAASPITRFLSGVYKPREVEVARLVRVVLNSVPIVYCFVLMACIAESAVLLGRASDAPGQKVLGFGLSLWTVMVFGTFPAHELLHSRHKLAIGLGAFLSGICGYPIQGLEHAAHHRRAGSTKFAEWARKDETVWAFVGRRVPMVLKTAIERDRSLRQSGIWLMGTSPLVIGLLGMVSAAMCFGVFCGLEGVALYSLCAASVFLSMQIMTFVQHWGLGDDQFERAREKAQAWEDDCLMQAWITLGNSFHMAHHREAEVPYYYLQPSYGSPRLPGCYVAMLVVCLVPKMWHRVMVPVLESFKKNEPLVCDPGRRVICISPSRMLHPEALAVRGQVSSKRR